jgi:hypothetical protein
VTDKHMFSYRTFIRNADLRLQIQLSDNCSIDSIKDEMYAVYAIMSLRGDYRRAFRK